MLKLEQIAVTYPDGTAALNNITLHIQKGERTALLGANGAGKSTLLSVCTGIIQPDKGDVVLNGVKLTKQNRSTVWQQAGVVFQNPDDQLFCATVQEDIAFGAKNSGMNEEQTAQAVQTAVEKLEITHLLSRAPHKLSGGEKRRVAIASVLVTHPQILLLDEPTSFLDPRARREVIDVLANLPVTQLIATHDMDMALALCNRVIVLKKGSVFAQGLAKEILVDEQLMQSAGLELPLCCQKIQET
ncbi:MAG: energy-coupling factor ABC transporter ATP-binding protein [Oscillospiraceae bacterium]|nr:energy-coupling factor ABC transporter ATP-binding protein [Oscillospiraceae bacterium]